MEYRQLGKTSLQVSVVALGCEGFMNKSDEDVQAMVDYAHQEGINFVDFFSSNPQGRSAFGKAIERIGLFKVLYVQHGKMVNMKEQERWMKLKLVLKIF